jgi:hypothetical protein
MSGASTPATARGGTLFRSTAAAGFVGLAFDPDDRKDQDGPHAFAWGAIHNGAQPPRGRIRWKVNDGAHVKLFLVAAPTRFAGDMPSLRSGHG